MYRVAADSKSASLLRSLPQLLLNFQCDVMWKISLVLLQQFVLLQLHSTNNQASRSSPSFSSDTGSLASLPDRISPRSKPVVQQTNFMVGGSSYSIPPCSGSVQPDNLLSIPTYAKPVVTDFPEFESDLGSFKLLEEDTDNSQSELSSVLSSPHIAEQQQAVLNSIHRSQVSDCIA